MLKLIITMLTNLENKNLFKMPKIMISFVFKRPTAGPMITLANI